MSLIKARGNAVLSKAVQFLFLEYVCVQYEECDLNKKQDKCTKN